MYISFHYSWKDVAPCSDEQVAEAYKRALISPLTLDIYCACTEVHAESLYRSIFWLQEKNSPPIDKHLLSPIISSQNTDTYMKKSTILLTVIVLAICYVLGRDQINTLSPLGKWIFVPFTSLGIGALCFSFMSVYDLYWSRKAQYLFVAGIQLWGVALHMFAIPWGTLCLFLACGHTTAFLIRKLLRRSTNRPVQQKQYAVIHIRAVQPTPPPPKGTFENKQGRAYRELVLITKNMLSKRKATWNSKSELKQHIVAIYPTNTLLYGGKENILCVVHDIDELNTNLTETIYEEIPTSA